MSYVVYFLLDCIDTLAIYMFAMTIFQYPIKEYIKEISIICATLAVSSILIREVIGLAGIDPLVHVLLLILCLRYLIKIRLYRSIIITTTGVLWYAVIQAILSYAARIIGISSPTDLNDSQNSIIMAIQITAQFITFLLAALINRYDLGVTKFVRPPHDFYITKEISQSQQRLLITSVISIVIACTACYFFILHDETLLFGVVSLSLFAVVLILTYRRDHIANSHGDSSQNR